MDWYLADGDLASVPRLRAEVSAYLARHARAGSDLQDARLVVSELVANAMEHSRGPIWVAVRWDTQHPKVTVSDLGPGFPPQLATRPPAEPLRVPDDPLAESGRGLYLVSSLAHDLEVAARYGGGSEVSAVLDVERAEVPPALTPRPLGPVEPIGRPAGREAFLRALVVRLADEAARRDGAAAAQDAVSDVATGLGRQLEDELRAAGELVGRLTPQQVAECMIRLERAMDGDFYVLEANARRIVIGTARCPFGDAVRRAPTLCGTTSGLLGGVAARNGGTGRAAVLLEERLAIGDPGCRVVIWLDPDHEVTAPGTRLFGG